MKSFILPLLMIHLCHAQGTIWETRMIQNQIGGATSMPELVADNGQRTSLPIGQKGSRFELWGWKRVSGSVTQEVMLDSSEVGIHLPAAEITISSGDPHTFFHRTRVDKPFTVTYDISNLIDPAPNVPEASTTVRVDHYADLYTLGSYDGTQIESTTLVSTTLLKKNGKHVIPPYTGTNLTAHNIAERAGKERFIVYALAFGSSPIREIAKKEITILPAPGGQITGLDDKVVYRSLPKFATPLQRVYPATSTWVEIYEGAYSKGKRGIKFSAGYEAGGQDYPEENVYSEYANFSTLVEPTKSCPYTLVLCASTPFPGESIADGGYELADITINIDKTISINASVTTSK